MNPADIAFRPITPDDAEFLYSVYASTRKEELAMVEWTEPEKEAFLRSQFNAQHLAYQETYRGAEFLVILHNGRPAGRLYVARWEREIRIVDIALLPEHRGEGIGSFLLKGILAEGGSGGKRVTIHVEAFNRALALYQRLGFRKLHEHGVYYFLEWTSQAQSATEGV